MANIEVNRENQGLVQAIQAEVLKSKVFANVCLMFAMRERARSQVTAAALKNSMGKEGFQYTIKACRDVLQTFASLGIGKLYKDTKGNIRSLINIQYTLQSIGQAGSASQQNAIKGFSPRLKTTRFVVRPAKKPEKLNSLFDTPVTVTLSLSDVKILISKLEKE